MSSDRNYQRGHESSGLTEVLAVVTVLVGAIAFFSSNVDNQDQIIQLKQENLHLKQRIVVLEHQNTQLQGKQEGLREGVLLTK